MPVPPEKSAKIQLLRAILPSKPCRRPSSGGLLFPLLLGVGALLGLMALMLSRSTSQAQFQTSRHDQSRQLRRWAVLGIDEAFIRMEAALRKPDHPVRQFLLGDNTGLYEFELPLTDHEIRRQAGGRFGVVKANASVRLLDRRGMDSQGNRFFPGEAVGTLELRAEIVFDGTMRKGVSLLRHLPYRVSSVSQPRSVSEARNQYFGGFLQDYALFVRDGLREFRQTKGASLHARPQDRRSIRIELAHLHPEKRGRVFFGGTRDPEAFSSAQPGESPRGNYLFLNTPASWAFLLPDGGATWEVPLTAADCLKVVARLAPFRDGLVGLQGSVSLKPLPSALSELPSGRQNQMFLPGVEGAERNFDPPFALLESSILASRKAAEAVLEGAFRQRFLSDVTLNLDFSRTVSPQTAFNGVASTGNQLSYTFGISGALSPEPALREIWPRLLEWNDERLGPLTSAGNTDFLLCGGQRWNERHQWAGFPKPRLFNFRGELIDTRESGPGGIRAFNHFNLIHRDLQSGQTLTSTGILRPRSRELHLNGIVWAGDFLDLGDECAEPLTVKGQGVLMARSIRLRSGLRKAGPEDLCVLVARDGNIRVETDQEIQASLVAVNDRKDGRLLAGAKLNLLGSLSVDRLCSSYDPATGLVETQPGPFDWVIRYDPALRPDKPQFQISLARWALFERFESGEKP